MEVPSKFDDIRPFEPEELQEVYDRLASNEQFRSVVAYLYPNIPFEMIAAKMKGCKTNLDFQLAFCYPFLENLMAKASTGFEMDSTTLDHQKNYTFVSNHRDIVLDSALLDMLLIKNGFRTTCEIAIGNNLLSLPWVKDLVRINKSFIVERGLPIRQKLEASQLLSDYIHFAATDKEQNIWIAQREGRAKDSNDHTAEAIIKMLAMGGKGLLRDRLHDLNIVPTTISYEYDPCDYLKAMEFQQKRDDANWKKGPMDDIVSMKTGIMGYKGHVHYHCAAPINEWLSTLPDYPDRQEFFRTVAAHIDHDIHSNYMLYPGNYVALDELRGTDEFHEHYDEKQKSTFDHYIAGQLGKVTLPNPDKDYLLHCMLTMYANPAINYLAAK